MERASLSIFVVAAVLWAPVVGCAQSTEDACQSLAAARCDYLAACSPARMAAWYGDAAACLERVGGRCLALPDLPGADVEPSEIEACAAAYGQHPCDALLLDAPPEACRFTGDRRNGEGCATGAQCQSSSCSTPVGSECGKCTSVRKLGDPCSKAGSPCDLGLQCDDSGTCVELGAEGDPCSDTLPCSPRLACSGGECVAPAALGEPCDAERQCDPLPPLFCAPSGVCEAPVLLATRNVCEPAGARGVCVDPYPTCE